MSEENSKAIKTKCVVVGDPTTGKTCIANRFVNDTYDENSPSTNGASSLFHNFDILGTVLKMEIWDTAGQEKFKALNRIFYKDAEIVILVYDITKKKTFEHIADTWLPQVKECAAKNASKFYI